MIKFSEILAEVEPTYMIVAIPDYVNKELKGTLLVEGRWEDSKVEKNFRVRKDQPHNPKGDYHAHVCRKGQEAAKGEQVSWNKKNGSRHDQHTFNTNIQGIEAAKNACRDALGLPSDFVLEAVIGKDACAELLAGVNLPIDVPINVFRIVPRTVSPAIKMILND